MTTIQELHAEVWAFRREMAAYFPTPSQADSLAFAFTEIAEAVDATLRQNPVYKRNQSKEHSVERELAQCAMMLLTAIPEGWGGWYYARDNFGIVRISSIAFDIAKAYDNKNFGGASNTQLADIVAAIAFFYDLPKHLRAELARMRAKHGPVMDDGPASLNEVTNEHVYVPPVEGLQLADWKEGNGL